MRILIAEDSRVVALILQDTLIDGGHETIGPAVTSGQALALAETCLPDIALIDMNLADGPTGACLARELMHRWQVPSLIMSGQVMGFSSHTKFSLGFIRKPYMPEDMSASIDAAQKIIRGERPTTVPGILTLYGLDSSPAVERSVRAAAGAGLVENWSPPGSWQNDDK